ncbi:Hypothetical protein ZAZAV_404, partial [Cedratvirus Zaza IHUMI]
LQETISCKLSSLEYLRGYNSVKARASSMQKEELYRSRVQTDSLKNKSVVKHIFFHDKMSYTSNPANFYSRSNLSRGQGFAYPGSATQGAFVNGTQGVATSRNNYGYSNNTSYRSNNTSYRSGSGAGYSTNQGYRTGSSSASTCPCARGRR